MSDVCTQGSRASIGHFVSTYKAFSVPVRLCLRYTNDIVITVIIVKKLNSLKHLVRTTVAELNN